MRGRGRERGERKGGKQEGEKGEGRVEREDSKDMQPEYTKSLDYYFHRGTASSSSSASSRFSSPSEEKEIKHTHQVIVSLYPSCDVSLLSFWEVFVLTVLHS